MASDNIHTSNENAPIMQDEVQHLKKEIARLTRELRTTKNFLEKVSKTIEAKDTLGRVLSAANSKQRALTEILLENCPSIILLLDEPGHFMLCTTMFLNVTGTHNFNMIKNMHYMTVFSQYLNNDSLKKFDDAICRVLEGCDAVQIDEWIDFSGIGDRRYYSIEISGIGDNSKNMHTNIDVSKGVLIVFTDLTDFMREKLRAESASRAKSDFLATMSHEIRTPMNAIVGMTEMLTRSELNETQTRYLSDIRKSSQSLLAIINDILDFSKIEAGRMELVETPFNLRNLLDNLYSIFLHLHKLKGLQFDYEIDADLPVMIIGDENRLRQILTNLLSNALKYTNEGHVALHVKTNPGNRLHFEIRDSGIGIRNEDLCKLFNPFEQLDARKNKNIIGTGLGLAISYNLCQILGGNLWVESVYEKGSVFYVDIPFLETDSNVVTDNIVIDEFFAPNATVLVVDDIKINLSVAEAMLSVFKIKPDFALKGIDAIQLANEIKYDLIFMDHMMPEMDGIETTKMIRTSNELNAATPIVALTANVMEGMEEMFLNNCFNDFLPKPLELAALNLCLRKWLPKNLIHERMDE